MGRLRRAITALPYRLGYRWGPLAASAARKRWVKLRHPRASIRFGRHCYVGPGFSLHMPEGGSFVAGDGVEFRRGFRAEVGPNGRVVIGVGSIFTYEALIQCSTEIAIGDRCVIAQNAVIVDGNHRFRDLTKPMIAQGYDYRPITIGDDAAVMSKCTVIADIGERAFVGANSVVSRPVPAFTVAVGAPARPIDYFGPDSQASRNQGASSPS
jgi:acetyltransferase-like isoleucine patch superfamily enzyme